MEINSLEEMWIMKYKPLTVTLNREHPTDARELTLGPLFPTRVLLTSHIPPPPSYGILKSFPHHDPPIPYWHVDILLFLLQQHIHPLLSQPAVLFNLCSFIHFSCFTPSLVYIFNWPIIVWNNIDVLLKCL